MKAFYWLLISLAVLPLGCQGDRFRSDPNNRLTTKAEKANDFHAKQAVKLTQENIENKDVNLKENRKRLEKQQAELNEANARTSKIKKPKKHKGNFKFY